MSGSQREQKRRSRKKQLLRRMLCAFSWTFLTLFLFAVVLGIAWREKYFTGQQMSFHPKAGGAEQLAEGGKALAGSDLDGEAFSEPDIGDDVSDKPDLDGGKYVDEEAAENLPEGRLPADGAELGNKVDLAHLHSPYAILADLASGETLGERDSREKIYPASMTKIMTAILAIEHTDDLDGTVTLSDEMFGKIYAAHASVAGFEPGEHVKLRDLLYGILLPSGAECCITFAERISGSEEQFAELMNEKARELGMDHTHFCNTTGLHDPEHYSTVADIAVLLRYALQNETFREVFTSSRHSTAASNLHPDGFTFHSTMFASMESTAVTGGEILGGKTGYTGEAGLCLASLARVNGREYILVTAKADGTHQTEPFHIQDAADVYSQLGKSME